MPRVRSDIILKNLIDDCVLETSKILNISVKKVVDVINEDVRFNFTAFTDGACKGNPGPGGWGIVYINKIKDQKIIWSNNGGKKVTTNSEMELTAIDQLFKFIPDGHDYVIYIDSKYVLNSMISGLEGEIKLKNGNPEFTGWISGWLKRGWKTTKGSVAHSNIWKSIIKNIKEHLIKNSTLKFKWIKSHQKIINDATYGNSLADKLANEGIIF